MLSLDLSLLWTIVNLLVLYLLLKKFLFKPVCKMMDERTAKIQGDLDGAAQAKADAEKMKADYEAEIADAHSQAVEITNKAKERAGKECDLMIENARAESAKIIKDAEKSIANEKERALDDAKYQIADLAMLAAAKVIKKNVGGESDKETVDDFLSEVGASK
ncbi:F0F1 ATP synthase subunit B [Ruminococcus sp.]|uniref:F0F1 ATP synthase subunit B n=1 Tax=Ruminococcus sp. TaxID=41978 RepID=UPI0025D7040E|nr:F0F1 ATP synthase subunit B [Ruminococcus sp.]